jgi:hypothetical protein
MRNFLERIMNSEPGNELLQFATRFLESQGAVLEHERDGFEAVIPEKLSKLLGTPEYIRFNREAGEDGDHLYTVNYGTPLMEKMVEEACSEIPLLACELRFDYLKSGGFDRLIRKQFTFHNMSGGMQSSAKVKTDYLVLSCRYTAQSDEQKEGLIQLVFNYETAALIPRMGNLLSVVDKSFKSSPKIVLEDRRIKKILKQIKILSKETIMEEIAPFRESMIRRYKRDAMNLEEYFEATKKEMKSSLQRQGISEELIRDRKEKMALLPQELDRKKEDLFKKYSIKIRIEPCAVMFIRTRAVKILYKLRKARNYRNLSLIYNPVTKSIDPFVCEGCGMSMTGIYCCADLHLLCSECKRRCPACET